MEETILVIKLRTDPTLSGDPRKWDWHDLLDLHPDESIELIEAGDFTDLPWSN
jgi:hypothetical protein